MKILIVKTSSLGDIIQSFCVLEELKNRFPSALIDWVVESRFSQVVQAHPLIRKTIAIDIKGKTKWAQSFQELRKEQYDLLFDLQGNCKSGVITFLARAKKKIGYAFFSVREWPNILSTHLRFNVDKSQNIKSFYLGLLKKYFHSSGALEEKTLKLFTSSEEKEMIASVVAKANGCKIMVCPGSKWKNKQLEETDWIPFLKTVQKKYQSHFFFIFGDETERLSCEKISNNLENSTVVPKLTLPAWQNLMSEMDLVIGVDSSALHLCATTQTPSFSIFGPTRFEVFKPAGKQHGYFQGSCPYNRSFEKQCPILRTCPTGACIKQMDSKELFEAFESQCGFLLLSKPL